MYTFLLLFSSHQQDCRCLLSKCDSGFWVSYRLTYLQRDRWGWGCARNVLNFIQMANRTEVTHHLIIYMKYVLSPVLCPLSEFMFWLHCLCVILTDTSLPLEGAVSTVSAMLSEWRSEIQTGGSRGTGEQKYFSSGTNLYLPVLRKICFSRQSHPISILSFRLPVLCQSRVITLSRAELLPKESGYI